MKTKFDDNVAHDIPITKNSSEPALPWKISESEITRIEDAGENYKTAVTAPPLRVRAIFVVLLILAIFVFILNSVVDAVVSNNEMQIKMSNSEKRFSSMRLALEGAVSEKDVLSDNAIKLEKRVNDLNAQKELYAAVIETLTKKTDDTPVN